MARPKYMTVPAAVRELEKIEMLRQMDRIYHIDHAVTARQKSIIKAFGLDENPVWEKAVDLGRLSLGLEQTQ